MPDFFDKPVEGQQTEVEKIQLGDESYTKEELTQLIQGGKTARELETKWNTKIDRLMPEFTKATQEREELKRKVSDYESKLTAKQQEEIAKKPVENLTPEELKERALMEADQLGLVSQKSINKYMSDFMQAYETMRVAQDVASDMIDKGYPEISAEDLLKWMMDNDYRNPEKAYRDMFEKDIAAIDEKNKGKKEEETKTKVESIRKSLFVTGSTASTAGSKQPERTRLDRNNIGGALSEFFASRKGGEK